MKGCSLNHEHPRLTSFKHLCRQERGGGGAGADGSLWAAVERHSGGRLGGQTAARYDLDSGGCYLVRDMVYHEL